jgi:hypothetical protein
MVWSTNITKRMPRGGVGWREVDGEGRVRELNTMASMNKSSPRDPNQDLCCTVLCWDLSFGGLPLGLCRFVTFCLGPCAWYLSVGVFRLESFVWDLPFRIFRFECVA